MDYLSDYQDIFRNKTKTFFDKAQSCSQGILQSNDRNIEQVCNSLMEQDYFQMQHFISDSKWSFRDAIDVSAKQTSNLLPKRKLTGLIVDETGTVKKETKVLV